MTPVLRVANFMDSALEKLEQKGNLSHAVALYNPRGIAEKVIHFTPHPGDARFAKLFEHQRVEIYPFFDSSAKGYLTKLFGALKALMRVVGKLRVERVNIIRGRLPYFGSLFGCLAGRWLGIPSVVSLGGDNRLPQKREGRYYFGSKWVSFSLEKLVLLLCNSIIVPNAFTRDYVASIIGKGRANSKAVIIPWILDVQPDCVPELTSEHWRRLGINPDLPIVLIVGHLNRYKHSMEMYEVAAKILEQKGRQIQFVFCGDGPLRRDGETRLQALTGAHFVGWQPNLVVLALMRRAAVVLVPMSGFVLLEAAALGKAVVASRIEWHGEIIRDTDNGFLVEADAIEEWCQRILWIIDHPAEARSMGQRLRAGFDAEYSAENALAKEAELYFHLVASRPKAGVGRFVRFSRQSPRE